MMRVTTYCIYKLSMPTHYTDKHTGCDMTLQDGEDP